jgi:hypothetical protein
MSDSEEMEVIRNEVEEGLASFGLQELGEVCTAVDLPIPEPLKSNRNKLFRHLLTHLWTEADKEDKGFATYKIVHDVVVNTRNQR